MSIFLFMLKSFIKIQIVERGAGKRPCVEKGGTQKNNFLNKNQGMCMCFKTFITMKENLHKAVLTRSMIQ